jgi:hypothetical protein
MSDLRSQFPEMTDALWDIITTEAYDRGHSAGYDEYVQHVKSYYDLAMRIQRALNLNLGVTFL